MGVELNSVIGVATWSVDINRFKTPLAVSKYEQILIENSALVTQDGCLLLYL